VTRKLGRSRLERYSELIDELRSRGLTYRDISEILTDEFAVSRSQKHSQRFRARANPTQEKCRPPNFAERGDAAPDHF